MVDVHVHVGDPVHPSVQQPRDGQGGVVVHTEPRGSLGHGVVQPARDAQGVVRLPRQVLRPTGRWRVRVGSGLADVDGATLAAAHTPAGTAPPGATRLYNVGYRAVRQEPPVYRDGRTAAPAAGLEEQPRGLYAGAVGLIDVRGWSELTMLSFSSPKTEEVSGGLPSPPRNSPQHALG